MTDNKPAIFTAAIIGGGPAGLIAAEVLSQSGIKVDLYDAMPSVGRKFLLAGKGGLNITHAEPFANFVTRYGNSQADIEPLLNNFSPQILCDWVSKLGITTFVGSSQRIFPLEMKAAPLLRAWLHRLRTTGVKIHTRHRWLGWDAKQALRFKHLETEKTVTADVVILALGGGSWAKLGSNGLWVPLLAERNIAIAPLQAANCGFIVAWSDYFREHFAAKPLKSVTLSFSDAAGQLQQKNGELMLTELGVEGSLIYALSASLRDTINALGSVTVYLDLTPDKDLARVTKELSRTRGSKSMSNHLRRTVGISGVKSGLLHEYLPASEFSKLPKLAAAIKSLPLKLTATRPIDEAISTAGGVCFSAMNKQLMLKNLPGVFCAGEMLDWEAPTGGYLLNAAFASGQAAGLGAVNWLQLNSK